MQELTALQKQADELAQREKLEIEAAQRHAEIARRKEAEKNARAKAAEAEVLARLAQEKKNRKKSCTRKS